MDLDLTLMNIWRDNYCLENDYDSKTKLSIIFSILHEYQGIFPKNPFRSDIAFEFAFAQYKQTLTCVFKATYCVLGMVLLANPIHFLKIRLAMVSQVLVRFKNDLIKLSIKYLLHTY